MKLAPTSPQPIVAEQQRAYLRRAADQIETTGSLDGLDPLMIAVVLRAFAERIPDEPKIPKGQAPIFDAGVAALMFVSLTKVDGVRPTKAIERIAEQAGVSVEAIKKALRKKRGVIDGFQKAALRKPNRKG